MSVTTRSPRASADSAAAFAAFCEQRLTTAEAAAVVLACAESKGIPWDTPKRRAVWEALQYFARRHLTEDDLRRFGAAITRRLAEELPAVDPERVTAIRWPAEASHARWRSQRRQPRDGDEFLDQQRQIESDRARRTHVRNMQTQRYKALRGAALSAAGHRCERCGSAQRLELHHKHYATLGSERLQDAEILCRDCHERETQRQRAQRRARWKPLSSGRTTTWH